MGSGDEITSTAICGSDLHLSNGFNQMMEMGDIVGHEFMGEVVEVGRAVRNLRDDDPVVVPLTISCRACDACRAEAYSCRENSTRDRRSPRRSLTIRWAGSSATRA